MEERGYAKYTFLLSLVTSDYNIVNNFGFRHEEEYKEQIIRAVLKALAEIPYTTNIGLDPIQLQMVEGGNFVVADDDEEEFLEEDDGEEVG